MAAAGVSEANDHATSATTLQAAAKAPPTVDELQATSQRLQQAWQQQNQHQQPERRGSRGSREGGDRPQPLGPAGHRDAPAHQQAAPPAGRKQPHGEHSAGSGKQRSTAEATTSASREGQQLRRASSSDANARPADHSSRRTEQQSGALEPVPPAAPRPSSGDAGRLTRLAALAEQRKAAATAATPAASLGAHGAAAGGPALPWPAQEEQRGACAPSWQAEQGGACSPCHSVPAAVGPGRQQALQSLRQLQGRQRQLPGSCAHAGAAGSYGPAVPAPHHHPQPAGAGGEGLAAGVKLGEAGKDRGQLRPSSRQAPGSKWIDCINPAAS